MKKFEISLTQELKGHYNGKIQIDAKNKKEALNILKSMSKEEIDSLADWTHGDEYSGDYDTIEIDSSSITEL
jgi:hypothetical protein